MWLECQPKSDPGNPESWIDLFYLAVSGHYRDGTYYYRNVDSMRITSTSATWQRYAYGLSSLMAESIDFQIVFGFWSDGSNANYRGAYIDDIRIGVLSNNDNYNY